MRRLGLAAVALAVVPAIVAAQMDTSRMRGVDSTHGRRHRQTSAGAIGRSSRNYDLTHDQITQLQTALKQADCDPGPIDGVIGARTRRAMNCARQKNNVTGNNPNDLFRSLNLTFTTSDTVGGKATGRNPGMNRMRGDSSMNRSTRDSSMNRTMRRDSARRRPTTKKDTTRGP